MADILIRGMEMPKGCFDCNFCSLGNGFCYGLKRYVNESRKREKDCPLIPLPEGHGRLKDSRYIIDTIKETYCSACVCSPTSFNCQLCKITKVIEIIENAPTIVPAEGGTGDD